MSLYPSEHGILPTVDAVEISAFGSLGSITSGAGRISFLKENKMDDLKQAIEKMCVKADEISAKHWADSKFEFEKPPTHRPDFISEKWCRVVVVRNYNDGGNDNGSSVYCFVCLKDGHTKTLGNLTAGDIHKAASFKVPAKHARGNVFHPDFDKCLTKHGIVYLK